MPKANTFIDPLTIGGHVVPGIWRYMLPYDFKDLHFPEERDASCMNCPRVITDNYREDYRCCTYFPKVPNYMLGLAYKHDRPARKLVLKQLEEGFLLPEGMQETARMYADFIVQVSKEEFGQGESTLCPFLNKKNGFCGIYHFRNSVCSSFFCKNDHGDNGQKFWDEVTTLVMQVELALSQWSLEEIGFDYTGYIERVNTLGEDISATFDAGSRKWKPKAYKYLWGKDHGQELEVYLNCAEAIHKNRNNLWDIANDVHVLETPIYEKASNKLVPKAHRDEIGEVNTDEDVTVPPRSIYKDLLKKHQKLWGLPSTKLQVNPKVEIIKNPKDDEESRSFASKPYLLNYKSRKGGKKVEWRAFIDAATADALQIFDAPCLPSFETMAEIGEKVKRPPEDFVAEWHGKNVLTKA